MVRWVRGRGEGETVVEVVEVLVVLVLAVGGFLIHSKPPSALVPWGRDYTKRRYSFEVEYRGNI